MKKKLIALVAAVTLLVTAISIEFVNAESKVVTEGSYSKMLERAEAIVNYEWIPTQRIDVWNENPYNGKMYFEAGEKVKGVPYTLFSWELGVDGLLSLEQYKEKAAINYSTEAYCNSVAANRVGPVYGNCCGTFVSEVLGGNYMNGKNPRYDGVGTIERSSYGTCYKKVKAANLQPGDALSNTSGGHIVWVAENDGKQIKIYESTPPVSTITVLDLSTSVNSDGYLVCRGGTYNIVTKSNEIIRDDLESIASLDYSIPMPIKARTISTEKTIVYDAINGMAKFNKIYSSDDCFIDAIFENGWCHVNYPLNDGGLDNGYVETSVFFDDNFNKKTITTSTATSTYSRVDLSEPVGITGARDNVTVVGEKENNYQIIYPLSTGGYKLGWASIEALTQEVEEHTLNALCPFKAYLCTPDHIVCYNSDLTTSPGRIYTDDFCMIEEIYSDGWCRVVCPWSDGSDKVVYTKIENFVKNPLSEKKIYNSEKYIYLYSDSALTNQIYRIYPGDVCYTVGESGTSTQIFMPMSGKNYNVLGWCLTTDLDDEAPNTDILYGDVNGDSEINGKDLVRLRKYLLSLDESTGASNVDISAGADTNGDGVVNGKDLVRLRKYLLEFDETTNSSNIVLGP